MMHEGTISTGSGSTCSVCGLYWINSIRWLRNTTLPGVHATSWPTANSSGSSWSAAVSALALRAACTSSANSFTPWRRLSPCVAFALTSTSGLVAAQLDGDRASIHCRVKNSTTWLWWRVIPSTCAASRHQLSAALKCSLTAR